MKQLRASSSVAHESLAAAMRQASRPHLLRFAFAVLFGTALLLPILIVMFCGWTLVGMYEESIGYRYFYSLRSFYRGEYVFLPQGQLNDVLYQALQAFLTVFGVPAGTLIPRIDWFAYAAVLMAHVTTLIAYTWTAWRFSILGRAALAMFWLLPYFLSGTHGRTVILQPDYQPWLPAIGLFAVTLFEMYRRAEVLRARDAVILGAACGLAATVKTTLVVFPATVFLAILLVSRRPSALWLTATLASGTATWTGVLLILYHGRVAYILRWISDFSHFAKSAHTAPTYATWLSGVLLVPPSVASVTVLLPILLAIALSIGRDDLRRVAVALLPGALAYHWIVYSRFTPMTVFEAFVFLQFAVTVVCLTIEHRWARSVVAKAMPSVLCFGAIAAGVPNIAQHLANIGANDTAGKALASEKKARTGRLATLVPENSSRFLSIDSAIYKGGSDVFIGRFGASPLVSMLAPRESFFTGVAEEYVRRPLDLTAFSAVLFTVPKAPPTELRTQIERLEMHYRASLNLFSCTAPVDFIDQFVYICDRREAYSPSVAEMRPFFVSTASNLTPGSTVVDRAGRDTKLGQSATVISGESGQMIRLSSDGPIRISTTEGSRVRVENAGMWDPLRQKFDGLGATFLNGQWRFDTPTLRALNSNPTMAERDSRGAVQGFAIYGGRADEVGRHIDREGSYVRVVIRRSREEVGLRALVQWDGVHDPLSVRARVRAPAGMTIRLRIHDALQVHEPSLVHFVDVSATGATQAIVMSGLHLYGVPSGDNIAVGLMRTSPGDWLEVRELGLYLGTLPNQ